MSEYAAPSDLAGEPASAKFRTYRTSTQHELAPSTLATRPRRPDRSLPSEGSGLPAHAPPPSTARMGIRNVRPEDGSSVMWVRGYLIDRRDS